MLFWQVIGIFVIIEFFFGPFWNHVLKWPPVPHQFLYIYTVILIAALFVYVTSSKSRMNNFLRPVVSLLSKPERAISRAVVLVGFPLLLGTWAYFQAIPKYQAPAETRSAHPSAPADFNFKGESLSMQSLENPYGNNEKENPEKFKQEVMEGAKIYYQNCFFCHGDNLDGNGPFHEAFNPSPANFTDQGTITQLEENYVFWRISTGGPGLPPEGKPWNSAMPVWQNMLPKDDIWKAVLWIYKGSGSTPRTFQK